MEKFVLPKEKLSEWINTVIPTNQVYAPVEEEGLIFFMNIYEFLEPNSFNNLKTFLILAI